MLSNAYFLAKFRFDTAENEPAKNLQNLLIFPILLRAPSRIISPSPRGPEPGLLLRKLPSGRPLRSAGTCRWEIAGTSRHSSPAQRTQNLQICKISKFSEFSRERASKNSQNVLINVTRFYPILQNLANLHV